MLDIEEVFRRLSCCYTELVKEQAENLKKLIIDDELDCKVDRAYALMKTKIEGFIGTDDYDKYVKAVNEVCGSQINCCTDCEETEWVGIDPICQEETGSTSTTTTSTTSSTSTTTVSTTSSTSTTSKSSPVPISTTTTTTTTTSTTTSTTSTTTSTTSSTTTTTALITSTSTTSTTSTSTTSSSTSTTTTFGTTGIFEESTYFSNEP